MVDLAESASKREVRHVCCTRSEIDRAWNPLEVKKTEDSDNDILGHRWSFEKTEHCIRRTRFDGRTWMSPTMLLQVSRSPTVMCCAAISQLVFFDDVVQRTS